MSLLAPLTGRQPTWQRFTSVTWLRQIYAEQHDIDGEWMRSRLGRSGASSASTTAPASEYQDAPHEFCKLFDPGFDASQWRWVPCEAPARGTRNECVSNALYMIATGNLTKETGLWLNGECTARHASPDGIIYMTMSSIVLYGDATWGLLEIKTTFYKFYEVVPTGYAIQMQQQMWTLKATWTDFFVYYYETGEVKLMRIYRDDVWIEWLAERFRMFNSFRSAEECQERMENVSGFLKELGVTSATPTPYDFDALARKFRMLPRSYRGVNSNQPKMRPALTAAYLRSIMPSRPMRHRVLFETKTIAMKTREFSAPHARPVTVNPSATPDIANIDSWMDIKVHF